MLQSSYFTLFPFISTLKLFPPSQVHLIQYSVILSLIPEPTERRKRTQRRRRRQREATKGVRGDEGRVYIRRGVPSPTICRTSRSPAWEQRRGEEEGGRGERSAGREVGKGVKQCRKLRGNLQGRQERNK